MFRHCPHTHPSGGSPTKQAAAGAGGSDGGSGTVGTSGGSGGPGAQRRRRCVIPSSFHGLGLQTDDDIATYLRNTAASTQGLDNPQTAAYEDNPDVPTQLVTFIGSTFDHAIADPSGVVASVLTPVNDPDAGVQNTVVERSNEDPGPLGGTVTCQTVVGKFAAGTDGNGNPTATGTMDNMCIWVAGNVGGKFAQMINDAALTLAQTQN